MIHELEQFAEVVSNEITGFLAISVVNTTDGSVLVQKTKDKNINLEFISPFHLQIYNQAIKGTSEFDPDDKGVEEVLITANKELYVISASPDRKFLAILIVDKKSCNLGLARATLNKHRNTVGKDLDQNL